MQPKLADSAQNVDPLFPIGTVVATRGALAVLHTAGVSSIALLDRHVAGDWGEIHPADRGLNERALRDGARIFSVYPLPAGGTVWVITEADRSVTTLLLPSEY